MKSVGASLQSHLAESVTTVCTCWHITRQDGTELFFTDHESDLVVSGSTYKAAIGYNRTAIQNNNDLSVDNLDVNGFIDSAAITEQDLRAGKYDYAEVRVFLVNYEDLSQGIVRLRRGWLGEVNNNDVGYFKTELRGLSQSLQQKIVEVYSPECRTDLGSTKCKIPILPDEIQRNTTYASGDYVRVATSTGSTTFAKFENRIYKCTVAGQTSTAAPTFNTSTGAGTTDGTAVFEAHQAWTRHATITSVTDRKIFSINITESRAVDDWFNFGAVRWDSGDNNGFGVEIKDWTSTSAELELYLPAPVLPSTGDTVYLYPGCDKRSTTCANRYSNIDNFRGEPYVPGVDSVLQYPNSQ